MAEQICLGQPRQHADVKERGAKSAAGKRESHLADSQASQRGDAIADEDLQAPQFRILASLAGGDAHPSVNAGDRRQLARRRLVLPVVPLQGQSFAEPIPRLVITALVDIPSGVVPNANDASASVTRIHHESLSAARGVSVFTMSSRRLTAFLRRSGTLIGTEVTAPSGRSLRVPATSSCDAIRSRRYAALIAV